MKVDEPKNHFISLKDCDEVAARKRSPVERGVMPDVIEVKISIDDFPDNFKMSPPAWEMWVVGKLKSAGVPIKGILTFKGLEKGTIERYDDPKDFGASTYRWKA